jgi:hypothetical protein
LSHRWGLGNYTTLQENNLEQFCKEIPLDALSKTFLDAIQITREMGINYIWIDSLCIIQNNLTDWDKEAASMTEVYGGSSLNIAASGASDGSIGCFFVREQGWRCQIPIIAKGNRILYDVVSSSMLYDALDNTPLSKRGWVLQERLLPTQTLHFTSSEVFWKCRYKMASEAFPDRIPHQIYYSAYQYESPLSKSMWNWIVKRYTNCDLTKHSDKLVAISGIARKIQFQTKDQYVSGLWRENMEDQLCWSIQYSHCQRTGPYCAPT